MIKKYFSLFIISLFLAGCAQNQLSIEKNKIPIGVEPQTYQEIETILTRQNANSLKNIEEEILRLKEKGEIFWHDQNHKIQSRTKMSYLDPRFECNNEKEECQIIRLEVYKDSIPPEFKVSECDKQSQNCLITEPKFSKELANKMKYLPEFYGFGKSIYTIGNKDGKDIYSIFENEKEIFHRQMYYGTEGTIEEAAVVLDKPTFTFLDLKGWQENMKGWENNKKPIIKSNVWYNSETLNEKYAMEASSYLFSYKTKVGFVGEKGGKNFFLFNGQKISQDFDDIRTHSCCDLQSYPIELDEKGILFFLAKRGEKYFFVEVNLSKYMK